VPHGVVEGHAQNLDEEVNGIAGQMALRPAPIGVFDDEAGISGQKVIARLPRDELESAFFQKRNQWGEPGGADLLVTDLIGVMCAKRSLVSLAGCESLPGKE
jgi:hypothetical protein